MRDTGGEVHGVPWTLSEGHRGPAVPLPVLQLGQDVDEPGPEGHVLLFVLAALGGAVEIGIYWPNLQG